MVALWSIGIVEKPIFGCLSEKFPAFCGLCVYRGPILSHMNPLYTLHTFISPRSGVYPFLPRIHCSAEAPFNICVVKELGRAAEQVEGKFHV